MNEPLASRHCAECRPGTPPLPPDRVGALLKELPRWTLAGNKLTRALSFPDFKAAMAFLGRLADLAEAEHHHPDFSLHEWNKVDLALWTHAVGGLSENDFILAARISQVIDGLIG